ncbi:pyrimidine dimer DNA glycosylase/endonuclease V [Pasteurella oralis]|uniref:Pyrimidine dimer DNA glycosylase/endonuclease V n=1 Tax=Pasteurella oralis TaxID=1071947 RepID=A0ABW4NU52_9PAST
MTRINLVPPSDLCDQHLLAEHRELTRIPNAVAKGKYDLTGQPDDYKLGTGHVRFFFNRLTFLKKRYDLLHQECKARGFDVQYIWPQNLPIDKKLWLDYQPSEQALKINQARILERMPQKARFTPAKITT